MKSLRSILEGEMDNNQAAAPGKKRPKPGAFTKQQTTKNQNNKEVDTEEPNVQGLKPNKPVDNSNVDNQQKVNLKGRKTPVILNPKLEIKNPPMAPSVEEDVKHLLEKLRQISYVKGGKPYAPTHHRKLNHRYKVYDRGHYKAKPYEVADRGDLTIKAPSYIPSKDRAKWVQRHTQGKEYGYKHKGTPVVYSTHEGEVLDKSQLFSGKKAMSLLTRMRAKQDGDTHKSKEGKLIGGWDARLKQAIHTKKAANRADQVVGENNVFEMTNSKAKKVIDRFWKGKKVKDKKLDKALDKRALSRQPQQTQGFRYKAQEETIHEMSRGKTASYIKAAHANVMKRKADYHPNPKDARSNTLKIIKRTAGIGKAADKLAEELKHYNVDYHFGPPGGPQAHTITKRYKLPGKVDPEDHIKVLPDHHNMIKQGYRKGKTQLHKEDVVNELSTNLLTRYTRKAAKDTQKIEKDYIHKVTTGQKDTDFVKMFRKVGNRAVGMKHAQQKIGHNVNEIEEAQWMYHGSANSGIKELKPDRSEYMVDRAIGSHFAANPDISNKFTKKSGSSYSASREAPQPGKLYKARAPKRSELETVPQGKHSDQNAIAAHVGHTVFSQPEHKDLFKNWVQHTRNVDEPTAEKIHSRLSQGQSLSKKEFGHNANSGGSFRSFVSNFGGLQSDKHRQEIVGHYLDIQKKKGIKGLTYQNTSPEETGRIGQRSKKSYIIHHPSEIQLEEIGEVRDDFVNEMAPPINIKPSEVNTLGPTARSQIKPRVRVKAGSQPAGGVTGAPFKPPEIPSGAIKHVNPINKTITHDISGINSERKGGVGGQQPFHKPGGTTKTAQTILPKRRGLGPNKTKSSAGVGLGGAGGPKPQSAPKVATPNPTNTKATEVKSLTKKHRLDNYLKKRDEKIKGLDVTPKTPKTPKEPKPTKTKGGQGIVGSFVKGFFDKLQHNEYQPSPTLRIIREAVHSKGGGAKGAAGAKGQDTGSGDEHPISVFRKAIQLRQSVPLKHQNGDTTTVHPEIAHHMLHHYNGLQHPEHKLQMVSRVWHSSSEFNDVRNGRPAKSGTFGTKKQHWALKGIQK